MTTDDHPSTTSTTTKQSSIDTATWRPTRTSTIFVVLGTIAVSLLLAGALGTTVQKGLLVSAFGAGCLGAALWLSTWERWRIPAITIATLLFIPAGVAITVGIGYVLLIEFSLSFPAANSTRVVGQTLRILGVGMVVVGVTAALFGAAMAVRNVVTRETVSDGFSLLVRTATLPVGFAIVFFLSALVTNFGSLNPPRNRVTNGWSCLCCERLAFRDDVCILATTRLVLGSRLRRGVHALPGAPSTADSRTRWRENSRWCRPQKIRAGFRLPRGCRPSRPPGYPTGRDSASGQDASCKASSSTLSLSRYRDDGDDASARFRLAHGREREYGSPRLGS